MKKLKYKGISSALILYLFVFILLCGTQLKQSSLVNSIVWFITFIYLLTNQKKFNFHFPKNKEYIFYQIVILSFYIVPFFCIGIFVGYVKSPYRHTLFSIAKNLFYTIPPILGIETIRKVFIARNKNNFVSLIYITSLLILLELKYSILFNLFPNKEQFFQYCCSTICPMIANGILYTFLTTKQIPILSFRLFYHILILLVPNLPNINWFLSGILGLLIPILIYASLTYSLIPKITNHRKYEVNAFTKYVYTFTMILSIFFIGFILGIFPYKPIAILSNSMSPIFNRGDIVIYKKVKNKENSMIETGKIVIYQMGIQNIAHRIVSNGKEKEKIYYQTKGDNNTVKDKQLVFPDQIEGIYVFRIKYAGFPSVWLNDYFKEETKTEIK